MTSMAEHDHFGMEQKRERFGEPAKFVPSHVPPDERDHGLRTKGIVQLIVFQILVGMLVICYVLSIVVNPGEVPDDDPQWTYPSRDAKKSQEQTVSLSLQETKRSGDRRHCKWCGKYKPDRCHHCRVCRCCILKMDHHCPWLYNCVGFHNYKYFFLWLFYSVLTLHFIVWCMGESVKKLTKVDTPFIIMFLVLFGETLAFALGGLVTTFWGFHIWLMMKAMTTIEFCEKSTPKKTEDTESDKKRFCMRLSAYDSSVYDLGPAGNIRAVLGKNPFLWLLPVSKPTGDGINFVNDDTRLTNNLEVARGLRRKTHRRTQRQLSPGYTAGNDSMFYGYNSTDYQD